MPSTLESHILYTDSEWNTIKYFKDVVDFLKDKKISNILDAGGCTGKVTTLLIEKIPSIKNCIILEPILENYNFILNATNNFEKIKVIQKALFYGQSHIELGQRDDNVGGWSFRNKLNKTDKIETITLEDFSNIDFLKMDIEGAETIVISNSSYIHEIAYLEIEFHDELDANWESYAEQNLKNHKLKFSCPERSNGFFIRKDLIK